MSANKQVFSSENYQDLPVIINGAGLVGCLAALYMAQHHSQRVILIDKRQDYRSHRYEGRSINLAISHRAFKALGGIDKSFIDHFKDEKIGLKMTGRGLHMKDKVKTADKQDQFEEGKLGYQPYGTNEDEYIVSVGRHYLNCFLLEELEKRFSNRIQVVFEASPTRLEFRKINDSQTGKEETISVLSYKDKSNTTHSVTGKFIIGCDGLNSFVRQQLQINPNARFSYSQTYISHAYKELSIRADPKTKDFIMRKDCLHIWPRGDFMLIALPNPTKDFTVTLFMRHLKKKDYGEDEKTAYGQPSFESVELGDCKSYDELTEEKKEQNVRKFFKEQFPDAYDMVKDHLMEDWNTNPTSALSYIQCNPHHYEGKVVLLGDSAHAIIPFYGQGVNCGFEDCLVFSNILKEEQNKLGWKNDKFSSDLLEKVFTRYSEERKPSADAILNLSLHNFIVMRAKTASPLFLIEQAVMRFLHRNFPTVHAFKPLYTMVAFTPDRTYADAWNAHVKREETIENLKKFVVRSLTTCTVAALSVFVYSKLYCKPTTTSTPSQSSAISYVGDLANATMKRLSSIFGYNQTSQ
ncbi:hypothetical protein FDP41_001031 [Naegleria fowleri]|uniref:FAD-binding domain-containing protein n=1 Tax=Naegleria fowleri TaxID=5763 RepID=A0A6A5C1V0_NAEFO|nr:uncharacterized protein FDP41_001031 [Naegleria fowleri]KAF0979878.1 hypothetical protein FDP41_001031 [Naegleria fowleri]CAG4714671.1 unnamed protein product [Naegleria fowleri]